MKLKHFSLFFSIAGILILYLISKLSQIPLIELNEMPDYEGKKVILEGIVYEFQYSKQGNQIIQIKECNDTAIVFIEGKSDIDHGDRIQAIGEVQKYGMDWELIVSNNCNIKILKKMAKLFNSSMANC
jgi:hypothetical protein